MCFVEILAGSVVIILVILALCISLCCYLCRRSRRRRRKQASYGYNEVLWIEAGQMLSLLGQTCAVCLEEFHNRHKLGVCPCSHPFHKKCLLKWLEVRNVCPLCSEPICRFQPEPPHGSEPPPSLVEA